MNNCKGKTKNNKKCKRKCKGKHCYQHQKKGGGILKKEVKKGRFLVSPTNDKKVKLHFEEKILVKKIRNNDCPKKNRPRLKKVYLDPNEKEQDRQIIEKINKTIINKKLKIKDRRKKYQKFCPKHTKSVYSTKNSFLCCQ